MIYVQGDEPKLALLRKYLILNTCNNFSAITYQPWLDVILNKVLASFHLNTTIQFKTRIFSVDEVEKMLNAILKIEKRRNSSFLVWLIFWLKIYQFEYFKSLNISEDSVESN